jgi:TolB-like protein
MSLDGVITQAAKDVESRLSAGTKLAVLNFTSTAEVFSDYVIEELTGALVMSRNVTVIERKSLDLIRKEMNVQLSGDVSDDSAQAIGKQLGAQAIVTGSLTNLGDVYRFRVKVINVETARIEAQFSYNLGNNQQVAFLLNGNQQNAPPVASVQGQAAPKPPQTTGTTYKTGDTGPAGGAVFYPIVRTGRVPRATSQSYKAGDTGPAGGLIFYVNPNANEGWKYLEAAPATAEATCQWSISQTISTKPIKDVRSIGTGKPNSEYIMQQAMQLGGGFGWAAQICDELEVNGFDDWFLPSRDELNVMWGVLHRRGLGGFKSEWYWSSTPFNDDGTRIWIIDFTGGEQAGNRPDNYGWNWNNWNLPYRVRAIRQF